MLRFTTLRYPPKPSVGKAFWDTLQKKGMKEASKFAKGYAKDFSKSGQGQDIYKKMAKTTAAAEARVKATFTHYWNAFHDVKSNIKTGTTETASDNGTGHAGAGGAGGSSSSSSGSGSSSSSGGRSFFQRADDFWRNNKEYIMSFLAANFMAVVFAFQYGSQVWGLVSGLWNVYWQNAAFKAKKLEEEHRRAEALRLAQEESEDSLDDVYGGTMTDDHVLKRGAADPENHGITNQAPNRAASATNAAVDEETLQKRLARREERRRRKELEESGLVMHDDNFARREEERQSSLLTGTPLSRKLEKEEVQKTSGVELLATALLKQEEDEHIDGALSATDILNAKQRAKAAMEDYWSKKKQEEKKVTRKMRRKIRAALREKELQSFFAQRDARNAMSSLTTENTAADSAAKQLAFTDSFLYSVGDGAQAKSFAAAHDQSHTNYHAASIVSSLFGNGRRGEEGKGVFSRLIGRVAEKQQSVFDFTSFDNRNSASASAGGGRRGGQTKDANVHDFTSATA